MRAFHQVSILINLRSHSDCCAGAALVAGSMTSGRVSDYYRSRFSMSADNSPPHHETRLHLQVPGIVLSLSGVLMYGWFLRFHIHVASVIVASAVGQFLFSS